MADLDALVLFARVVEAGGFSAAARRLKAPVSTVSRRIAELEGQLGVRLLERSTRRLRLTEIGADVLEHARRGAELSDAVDSAVSDRRTQVAGLLRLSAPPSLSDTLLAPLVGAFQAAYPEVRVRVFVTDRHVDPIADGIDLALRLGELADSSLIARRLLRYRHLLVASPAYLRGRPAPASPEQLAGHRLLAFAHWPAERDWRFVAADGTAARTVAVAPHLAMNDYAGLAAALLAGAGIGDLPPLIRPELLRDGALVEVMPEWRFPALDLSMVHLGGRHVPRALRAFKDFAVGMAPRLFPSLPA